MLDINIVPPFIRRFWAHYIGMTTGFQAKGTSTTISNIALEMINRWAITSEHVYDLGMDDMHACIRK